MWILNGRQHILTFHGDPRSVLTLDEVGQRGSFERALVVRNLACDPVGSGSWWWKVLWVLWLGQPVWVVLKRGQQRKLGREGARRE